MVLRHLTATYSPPAMVMFILRSSGQGGSRFPLSAYISPWSASSNEAMGALPEVAFTITLLVPNPV